MAGKDFLSEYSQKYGKPDLERLGIFIEMPYMNGKRYVSPFPSKSAKLLLSKLFLINYKFNFRTSSG